MSERRRLGSAPVDLASEAEAIRALKEQAITRAKQLIDDVDEIGRRLSRVKKCVPHGQWLPWLKDNFEWSADTAERYITVHRFVDKFRTLRNLDLSAIYALAAKHVQLGAIRQIEVDR